MVYDVLKKSTRDSYCISCSPVTDLDSGEIVCSNCGLVMVERLESQYREWRPFDDDYRRYRVGQPSSSAFSNARLFTNIGNENWDFSGKPFSFITKGTMNRLRLFDTRSKNHTSSDRNFYKMYYEFEKLKHKLTISDSVIENAVYLFRKATNKKLTRGRNMLLIAASCLYAACRESETPRTLYDIADAINVKKTDVSAYLRLLIHELELTLPTVNLYQCIVRVANNMGISEKIKRHALEIIQKAEQINMTAGKEPMGLAAAAIYLAGMNMGENYSQKTLCEISKITSVTLRNRSRELRQKILFN